MRKPVFAILVSCLLVTLLFVGKENIPPVKASPEIYHGDLVLAGNKVTVIEGRFDVNGSILVEENASLLLSDALLNFTSGFGYGIYLQNPSNGNPRLIAHNTTIIGMATSRYYGNGSVLFSNCSIFGPGTLYFYDESNVTIFDSNIEKNLQARDSSRFAVFNSAIGLLNLIMSSANSSINNLNAGFFDFWDFWLNCSVIVSPSGRAPNVTLNQTTILGWSFSFQDSSRSEILNSEIWLLHANENAHVSLYNSTLNEIELYWTSVAELVNSSYILTSLFGESMVYVSRYLSVHAVDSILQEVPLANISVTFPNATLAESKESDVNGWARFTLLGKMMNATGEYPVGNYTVEATYDIHSDATTVNMTENQQITLTLADFVIPEFTSFLILPLFMIATLVAVIICRGKHSE
jgi:hypothetical protein